MSNRRKRVEFRPGFESFERRDIPAAGLTTGHVAGLAARAAENRGATTHAIRVPAAAHAGPSWASTATSAVGRPIHGRVQAQAHALATTTTAPIHELGILPRIYPNPFTVLPNIKVSDLKPGDILLSTQRDVDAFFIRLGTLSDFSHATLYVGNGKVIEAIAKGVTLRNISDATNKAARVGVIRVNGLTTAQEAQVVSYAQKAVGQGYNGVGLAATALDRVLNLTGGSLVKNLLSVFGKPKAYDAALAQVGSGYFCSQLVIKAYNSIGVTLAPSLNGSPEDILNYVLDNLGKFELLGRPVTK